MQKGWVAQNEMEYYMSVLEGYHPSSTSGVVHLPKTRGRDAMFTNHLLRALKEAHNDINSDLKALVFFHDCHWVPCVAEAKGDTAIIHVPATDYTWIVKGFTSMVGDHEVQFEMHPMPRAFPADCGFQAIGWMLAIMMGDDSNRPFFSTSSLPMEITIQSKPDPLTTCR